MINFLLCRVTGACASHFGVHCEIQASGEAHVTTNNKLHRARDILRREVHSEVEVRGSMLVGTRPIRVCTRLVR